MHVDTHHQLYLHHLVLSKILFEKEVVFHQISIYMKHNHMDKHLCELTDLFYPEYFSSINKIIWL